MVDTAAALKAGQLPADADPQVWRERLDRQARTQRRLRLIAPIEFAAFAALGVWLALSQGPVWWVFVAFFVLVGIACTAAAVVSLRRIDRLRQLLHR
jgi:fatty acid desaturase